MRFSIAILLAILFHGVLATLLGVYLAVSPNPVTLAQLDVTSVELSFAEEEADTAPIAPVLPSPPPEPPSPREELPEPERESLPELPKTPPEADAVNLPEPTPEQPKMDIPSLADRVKEIAKSENKDNSIENRKSEKSQIPSPPLAPRQAKINAPPSPKKAIKPDYPRGARQRGEEGDVVIELHLSARGRVERVSIVTSSGFPELDDAALRAIKSARFTPAKRGDASVPSTARMTLTFRLNK